MEKLSRFNYTWLCRPGRINVADPLSRNPALTLALISCAMQVKEQKNLIRRSSRLQVKKHKATQFASEEQDVIMEPSTYDVPMQESTETPPAQQEQSLTDDILQDYKKDKRSCIYCLHGAEF